MRNITLISTMFYKHLQTFTYYSNADGLDVFPNLKILILDHNNFTSVVSLPSLSKLETLSISYNAIRDLDTFLF